MTKIPEYVNRLSRTIAEDVANGTFWDNVTDEHTHANSRHVGMTSKSMLERMFKDGKPQVSAFNRDRDMRECIVECVLSDLPAICKKNRQKGSRPYSHSVQLADDIYQAEGDAVDFKTRHRGIIRGRDGGIREMTSDVTTIILRPDDKSKYGFRLITAFPEMSAESAHETGRDLTDICRQTEAYKTGTETCRTYMMAATDEIPKGFSIAYHPADRGFPDSLSISFPSNNSGAEHCVYIDEISMNMRTYTYTSDNKRVSAPCTVGEKPCKRLDLTNEVNTAMFTEQYPDAARYIDKILDRISEERMKIRAERPRRMPNVNIPSGPDLQTDKDFGD